MILQKKPKKIIIGITILAVLLGLLLLTVPSKKQSIFMYVQNNYSELESFAIEFASGSGGDTSTTYNGWDVAYWLDTNSVEFITQKQGIVSGSTFYGFYYSPEDIPLGFQGYQAEFEEYGSGWQWNEIDGDNREYTERITEKWFWLEVKF